MDHLGKFDPKADDGIFLGYSSISKSFRVFDKRRQHVKESMHVNFDESRPTSSVPVSEDEEELNEWMKSHYGEPKTYFNNYQNVENTDEVPDFYNSSSTGVNVTPHNQIHPPETSLGNSSVNNDVQTTVDHPSTSTSEVQGTAYPLNVLPNQEQVDESQVDLSPQPPAQRWTVNHCKSFNRTDYW